MEKNNSYSKKKMLKSKHYINILSKTCQFWHFPQRHETNQEYNAN